MMYRLIGAPLRACCVPRPLVRYGQPRYAAAGHMVGVGCLQPSQLLRCPSKGPPTGSSPVQKETRWTIFEKAVKDASTLDQYPDIFQKFGSSYHLEDFFKGIKRQLTRDFTMDSYD